LRCKPPSIKSTGNTYGLAYIHSEATVPSSSIVNPIPEIAESNLPVESRILTVNEKLKLKGAPDSEPAHHRLVRAIQHIPKKVQELEEKAAIDGETYRSDAVTAAARGGLFLRQLRIEEEQQEEAVNTYTDSLKELISIGRGTGLKHVQRILLRWYEPLTQEIAAEMKLIARKVPGNYRAVSVQYQQTPTVWVKVEEVTQTNFLFEFCITRCMDRVCCCYLPKNSPLSH
jgi:hypothetical protein